MFDREKFLKQLSSEPGIYKFLNKNSEVIYIGKAKNLRKRVSSYFKSDKQDIKINALQKHIHLIEVTITPSEADALILENILIKQLQPKYNILLKDDKSYPYLCMDSAHKFPRLFPYRGKIKQKNKLYFGPYVNSRAMHDVLLLIQKIFKIRNCPNSQFRYRTRPCLQHQINRCKAPCVGLVTQEEYKNDLHLAQKMLSNKSHEVTKQLKKLMLQASDNLNFEEAQKYREKIKSIEQLSQTQITLEKGNSDKDIVVFANKSIRPCVQVMSIRQGRLVGSNHFFFSKTTVNSKESLTRSFFSQYYLTENLPYGLPDLIQSSNDFDDHVVFCQSLKNIHKKTIKLSLGANARIEKKLLDMAYKNIQQNNVNMAFNNEHLTQLANDLGMSDVPHTIDAMDISHFQGEAGIGVYVSWGEDGRIKQRCRHYLINEKISGDDYAAMAYVVEKQFNFFLADNLPFPDILIVDGGKGQIAYVRRALMDLSIHNKICVLGMAKGESRKAGMETFFLNNDKQGFHLPSDSISSHLLQVVRDNAHNSAIYWHKRRRAKLRKLSPLERLSGIGPKKRQELLKYFGGMQGIKCADVATLAQVKGITQKLAERIFHAFHS